MGAASRVSIWVSVTLRCPLTFLGNIHEERGVPRGHKDWGFGAGLALALGPDLTVGTRGSVSLSLVPELPPGKAACPLVGDDGALPFQEAGHGVECSQQEAEGSDALFALFVLGLAAFLNPI